MRRRISSSWTFFYKRVFPAVWIAAFATGTFYLWASGCAGRSIDPALKWIALFSLIGGSGFLVWFSRRLKVVWVHGDDLIVSDYRSEERIPMRQIEGVSETRIWNPKLIKLRLLRPAKWGDIIVFVAPIRFQFVFMNHPLVRELRELILDARAGGGTR